MALLNSGGTSPVPGRSAVIVFFVISGYVIAYVTDKREQGWRAYTVSRIARIYSVALPALLLTGLLYAVGRIVNPDETPPYDHEYIRLAMAVLFLNQIWNFTVQPLTNGPYWSLCYEVWYYVMFGLWCFLGPRWRAPAIIAIAVMVGPRILLLAPLWLLGVWLYRLTASETQHAWRGAEWLLLLSVAALVASILGVNPASPIAEAIRDRLVDGRLYVLGYGIFIGGNWVFPLDYVVGATFALTVLLAGKCRLRFETTGRLPRAIRHCASYTFSLYLYHAPLLVFIHAFLGPFSSPWTGVVVQVGLILIVVYLLGRVTEQRKQPYVAFLSRMLAHMSERRTAEQRPSA